METLTKTDKALEGAIVKNIYGLVCMVLMQLENSCLLVPYGWTSNNDEERPGSVSFGSRVDFGNMIGPPKLIEKAKRFLNPGTFYADMVFEVRTSSVEKCAVIAYKGEAKALHQAMIKGYRSLVVPGERQKLLDEAVDGIIEQDEEPYIAIHVKTEGAPIVSAFGKLERRIAQIKRNAWFAETIHCVPDRRYRDLDLDKLSVDALVDFRYGHLERFGGAKPVWKFEDYLDYLDSEERAYAAEEVVERFDEVVDDLAAAYWKGTR